MLDKEVSIVTPWISRDGGGVSESARLLGKALASLGYSRVTIVTTLDENFEKDSSDFPENVVVLGFPYYGPANYRFSPGMLWHMLFCKSDIVHVHGLWMFHCFAVLAWSLRGGHYVVSPHGMLEEWILRRSPRLKGLVSKLYQDLFIQRAGAFHALTSKEVDDIKAKRLDARCEIIPNYASVADGESRRPAWWRPEMDDRKCYLFLGRIHDKKGWRELLQAWLALSEADEQFSQRSILVFAGWMDGASDFEQLIDTAFAKVQNVYYVGPQFGLEKNLSIRCTDFFLLPSKSEGLPMTILEAWAAATPVIMTPECNLPIGFSSGAAIKTGPEVGEIVKALQTADGLSDTEVQRMKEAGLSIVAEHFSEKAVAEKMMKLYASVS